MLEHKTAVKIMNWQHKNGGFFGHSSGHALKLLGEAIELCVTCGASSESITSVVNSEIEKARYRGELHRPPNKEKTLEEIADVTVLLTVLTTYLSATMTEEVEKKLPVLNA